MVNEQHTRLLEQILALTDTACQASLELLDQYTGGHPAEAAGLLEDLEAAAAAVRTAQEPLLPQLEHAYTSEMLENVEDTLADIRAAIEAGNGARAAMKMEFQLFPFLRQLREAFYFWGAVYPDGEAMERYYREEFAARYSNPYVQEGEPNPVRLSIVMTGYNHLETTRQCVEQLLKVTDLEALHAELLLIDHGSTDGTLDYFESLGVGKVIHFKRNVRMYMFTTLAQLCQGTYFSFVSNDILVTKNWADILLNCLESDEKIIAAVPATPHIANLQALGLPDSGAEEFVAWANEQNRPDPSRWNDRARLMPPLGMYRTGAVSRIGFADPYFFSMEYWDDDFSLRARRAGYRQIVCDDAACYHFGSVTGKEAQVKENTLVYGRELFQKKNGVDAWGSGFCYDYTAIQLFKQLPLPEGEQAVLGLDCGMGDTPLQIGNELRHTGRRFAICQLTSQKAYLPDIAGLSKEALYAPELAEGLASAFGGRRFSAVCLGRDIAEYPDPEALLAAVSKRMVPGGWLIFSCANPFFAGRLHPLLQFALPGERLVLADPADIQRRAGKYFSNVQMVPLGQAVGGLEEFAKRYYGRTKQLPQIVQRLGIERYYFACGT